MARGLSILWLSQDQVRRTSTDKSGERHLRNRILIGRKLRRNPNMVNFVYDQLLLLR